jgi:protein-tyrosine phosphatase
VIDLHCHILPELDDGSLSVEDSVAMARQAERDSIAIVCATPHVRHDHSVRVEEIAERVQTLQQHLDDREIAVEILPGGELAQTEAEHLSDAQLHLVALGGAGGWVLLEPAPGPMGDGLEECVEMLAGRGLRTVIAHPERHAGSDFEERLRRLAGQGCLIQWTAAFVADPTSGDLVPRLAGEGLVHLLGSDAHSSYGGRPVELSAGVARLAAVYTAERIEWIVDRAPRAIVRGETVAPMP